MTGSACGFTWPMPTPAVAYLTRALRLQAGAVISASHNPYEDNGIKFFSANGFKLPADRLWASIYLDEFREAIDLLQRELEAWRPDIVGVTAITAMEPDAREVCRAAKRVHPGTVTVLDIDTRRLVAEFTT